MKKLENFFEKHWFLRSCFDVAVPILGDYGMYKERIKRGLSSKEALHDIAATLILKYFAYGRAVYQMFK